MHRAYKIASITMFVGSIWAVSEGRIGAAVTCALVGIGLAILSLGGRDGR